jgi:hypothetical protein
MALVPFFVEKRYTDEELVSDGAASYINMLNVCPQDNLQCNNSTAPPNHKTVQPIDLIIFTSLGISQFHEYGTEYDNIDGRFMCSGWSESNKRRVNRVRSLPLVKHEDASQISNTYHVPKKAQEVRGEFIEAES